jgi:small GTP-binding protein
MSERLEDLCFKVIVLGNSSVGKSCLLTQFIEERFESSMQSTVGVGYGKKTITDSAGRSVTLEIWDTVENM